MRDLRIYMANCKAYPDEKGIETISVDPYCTKGFGIAKPIPMKRELKPKYYA